MKNTQFDTVGSCRLGYISEKKLIKLTTSKSQDALNFINLVNRMTAFFKYWIQGLDNRIDQ